MSSKGLPIVSHTVQQAAGAALMVAAPVAGVLASFDATVVSSAVVAVGLAVGGTITYLSGVRIKARTAAAEADRLERIANADADRALEERKRADHDAHRKAEIELAAAEASARLKHEREEAALRREIAAAEAAARIKLEADAHAAKLALEAEAERARIAMELEREAKLGPTMARKIEELEKKLATTLDGSEERLRTGQRSIEDKLDRVARRRVLVVEDDAATCRALTRFLDGKGFSVVCAATIPEARKLFTGRCDWIFVHRVVAGEDGMAYLAEIRAKGLNIKLALVTGHPGESVLEQAERAFVDLVCVKPLDLDRLLRDMRALEEKAPRPSIGDVVAAATGSKADFPAVDATGASL